MESNIINNNEKNNNDNNPNNDQDTEKTFMISINNEQFNPEEISVLCDNPMKNEITQLIQFLLISYPYEALTYCLNRCFNNTFSRNSQLDQILNYLLKKYKEPGENEINNILLSFNNDTIDCNIMNVSEFDVLANLEQNQRFSTAIKFVDNTKDNNTTDIIKYVQNEIFVPLHEKDIKDEINKKNDNEQNLLNVNGTEQIETFLCDNHELYKRFCVRDNKIYIFNFIGFSKIIERKKHKKKYGKKKNENEIYFKVDAIFECEEEKCGARYKYNFNSNKFTEIIEHDENVDHRQEFDANSPFYYKEIVKLLSEKDYITDVQLVVERENKKVQKEDEKEEMKEGVKEEEKK